MQNNLSNESPVGESLHQSFSEKHRILNGIIKLFALVFGTAVAAGVTCGGNLLVAGLFSDITEDYWVWVWGGQILLAFILLTIYIFRQRQLSKRFFIILFVIFFITIGAFLALCGGFFNF